MSTPEPTLPSNPYATLDDLRQACALYGVERPADDVTAARLLVLASFDVERFCGRQWAVAMDSLDVGQKAALRDAVAVQACFRAEQADLMLGTDDGLASTGSVTYSLRPVPRFSPDAAERLSGTGLIRRLPMASDPLIVEAVIPVPDA